MTPQRPSIQVADACDPVHSTAYRFEWWLSGLGLYFFIYGGTCKPRPCAGEFSLVCGCTLAARIRSRRRARACTSKICQWWFSMW